MSKNSTLKRLCLGVVMAMFTLGMSAVPARPGTWHTITLQDGTKIAVQLRGDESGSYYVDAKGNAYAQNDDGTYSIATVDEALNGRAGSVRAQVRARIAELRKAENAELARKAPRKAQGIPTDKSKFKGKKKGLIILAQFKDQSFSDSYKTFNGGYASVTAMYRDIINNMDFNAEPFHGSVRRYFHDQSRGQFDLDFDVAGPVTLAQNAAYYGGNLFSKGRFSSRYSDTGAGDGHASYMVYEAIQKAFSGNYAENGGKLNASDYDWDGDGEMEFIFVIYAGQGEADGGSAWTIWPHKFTLTSGASNESRYTSSSSIFGTTYYYQTGDNSYTQFTPNSFGALTYNGTKIDTYACSNELATNQTYNSSSQSYTVNGTQLNGIGTICHEFSHTMGYPDMYDVSGNSGNTQANYAMGAWDLMCSGSYNGSWNGGHNGWASVDAGYCPAGYTSFERWCAGWEEPIVLNDPQKITNLKPVGGTPNGGVYDYGKPYVVYMPGSTKSIEGEYYLLENRQNTNWDTDLPWFGLTINYVHYNASLWNSNCLNTTNSTTLSQRGASNTHQRMTVFQASGNDPGLLSMDAYPWKMDYPTYFLSSSLGATGEAKVNYINTNYGSQYGVKLNTTDMNHLDDTSTPAAYYWGTGSSSRTLTGQEIWNIETNRYIQQFVEDGDTTVAWVGDSPYRTVNFIYRKASANNPLNLDQTAETEQTIAKGLYTSVSSNKPVDKDIYNPIWLPFSMNRREVLDVFGSDARVYAFTGVTESNDTIKLNFTTQTGLGIPAYQPVLVKQGNGDAAISTFSTDNLSTKYMQVETALSDTDEIAVTRDGWKFAAAKTYAPIDDGDIYFSDFENYVAQSGAKEYAPVQRKAPGDGDNEETATGELYGVSNGSSEVHAYSAYFVPPTDVSSKSIVTTIDGVVTGPQKLVVTGIKTINFDNDQAVSADEPVYTIGGQQVGRSSDFQRLPQGIYVVKGKKVVKL